MLNIAMGYMSDFRLAKTAFSILSFYKSILNSLVSINARIKLKFSGAELIFPAKPGAKGFDNTAPGLSLGE
jgi:hypothetical protein